MKTLKLEITEAQQEILSAVLLEKLAELGKISTQNAALRPAIKTHKADVLALYKSIVAEIVESPNANGIEITEIKINPLKKMEPGSNLTAYARIVLNGQLCINSIRVVEGKFGPFISFPREFNQKEGKGYNLCYPITKALQDLLSERILRQWRLATTETSPSSK